MSLLSRGDLALNYANSISLTLDKNLSCKWAIYEDREYSRTMKCEYVLLFQLVIGIMLSSLSVSVSL